jgi:endonuclease III
MATTINKQRLLSHLFGAARKAAGAESEPDGPRPVLQEFIYALCREGASRQQADSAFANLCERFFDWNEVRVSSLRELEEAFAGLPNAGARAERLSAFLREVFETEFSFDLDKQLLKKGLKLAAKQLASYEAANDYIGAWVMQRSLGGHAIPLDAPTLRCAQRLGLIDGNHLEDADARASLEHLVPKAKGAHFTDLVSCLADKYCREEHPHCSACPMARECAYAHENGVEQLAVVGGRRPKPR